MSDVSVRWRLVICAAAGETDAAGKVQLRLPPGEYDMNTYSPAGSDYVVTLQSVQVAKTPIKQTAEVCVRRGADPRSFRC